MLKSHAERTFRRFPPHIRLLRIISRVRVLEHGVRRGLHACNNVAIVGPRAYLLGNTFCHNACEQNRESLLT